MAARIAQQSPYIFAFNMYGHPFWESFVGHSGEKCDLTLIVYPWFCHSFCTVFDRYLQKHNIFRAFWSLCSFGALRTPYRKARFYRHYRGNPYINTFSAWERHSSVRPVLTTIAMKNGCFMSFFASYIDCLRYVWAPVGGISLAIAQERTMFPRFCICVSHGRWYTKGAVGFNGCVSTAIAWNLRTDPSGKGGTLWKLFCIAFSSI